MAADVIIQGALIEFLNEHRCKACQERSRDCILKTGAGACLLCSDNGRPCIFERSVVLRGPANCFLPDTLTARSKVIDIGQAASAHGPAATT